MRWLALVLLSGCNWVFDLAGTDWRLTPTVDARPDAVGCSGVRFGAAVRVSVPFGDNPGDPELSDPLQLWLSQDTAAAPVDRGIYFATRTDPSAPFGVPVLAPNINSPETDDDPALTADGLDIFFVSARASQVMVYEATRASRSDPFGTPLRLPELDAFDPGSGIDVSWDGLTLYVTDVDHTLHEAHRPGRDQPFVVASGAIAANVSWPGVSPDGRELFYVDYDIGGGILRQIRIDTTPGTPFDGLAAPESIDAAAADPDVTPDADKLVTMNGGNLQVLPRMCP